MTINWRSIGWISAALTAIAVVFLGAVIVTQRDLQAELKRMHGTDAQPPLITGFGSLNAQMGPNLHCVPLPTGIALAHQPTSKAWMDGHFHGYADWMVISDRMAPGDDIYAYSNVPHPPPGVTTFTGLGGGYVVLRGWCLVGKLHTWVE